MINATITSSDGVTVLYETTLKGSARSFQTPVILLNSGGGYSLALEAINGAGLSAIVYSSFGDDPGDYVGSVRVVANFGKTENVSGELVRVEKVVEVGEEVVCLWETNVVRIVFSAPEDSTTVDSQRSAV